MRITGRMGGSTAKLDNAFGSRFTSRTPRFLRMTPLTALVSTAALGIGANTENLPIGLAYGLRGREIGLFRNLVIAAVTTAATVLPQIAGQGLHGYLPTKLPDVAAGLLLMGLG